MAAKDGSWVQHFVVSSPVKHMKGFTLYKVTYVSFPKIYPEAVSKVVVWKRYNDFKKLHSELKNVHNKLHLSDKFPPFVKAKYFSRFEEEVIEERRRAAYLLLEFISKFSPLCNHDAFIRFFESSYTVDDQELGASSFRTNEIDDVINRFSHGVHSISSDDDATDTDSAVSSQLESLNGLINRENAADYFGAEEGAAYQQTKSGHGFSKMLRDFTSSKFRSQKDATEKPGYCAVAEQYVEEAELKEAVKNYRAAFDLYKKAISCWLSGVQSDMNHKRRKLIKEKTSMYLVRAEHIANYYLTDDIPVTGSTELLPLSQLWRSVSHLANYKVLNVIGKVMLVLDTNSHALYVIKALSKSISPVVKNEKCILPRGCPYIVDFYGIFETDSSVYLLLEHVNTGRLWDYITTFFLREEESWDLDLTFGCPLPQGTLDDVSYSTDIREPLTQSITDLTITLDSSHSSLSSHADSYSDLMKKQCKTQDQQLKTPEKGGGAEGEHLEQVMRSKKTPDLTSNQTLYNVGTFETSESNSCVDIFKPNLKRSSSFSCDIETETLVIKSQELLKSVSETLIKSENLQAPVEDTVIGNNLSKHSSLGLVDTCCNNPCVQVESGNSVDTDNEELHGIRLNNFLQAVDPSKLHADISRGYSPVSSGSEFGEIQSNTWGLEGRGLNPETVLKWASQLLVALNHFHLLGIIYRDLNPDNILVTTDGNIRITYKCEFPGVDHNIDRGESKLIYIAPEYYTIQNVTKVVDWWSYGVILYNLIAGKSLSHYYPTGIHEHSVVYIPDFVSPEAKSLLEQLLAYNPSERLGSGGVHEIKSHPYFKGVKWKEVSGEGGH